ncbi:MAG: hypothetical protein EU541_03155 [Promethearchaeota archaeon]|nr:MAG: hypothetical protein EU541_03155 [Candidatus Lokiarchaeota archaeon]
MKKSVLISILVISAVITGGILSFIFISYGTQGAIHSSSNYAYTSSSPNSEDILISADMCDVIINYNNSPMDYNMEAYFTAKIEGLFVKGRTFEDFFQYPQTQNMTNTKTILLATQEDLFKNPLNFFSNKEIKLLIVLRTDVVYDIKIDVAVGDITINIPEGVSVGNLDLETDVGDISIYLQENNNIGQLTLHSNVGESLVYGQNTYFMEDISISTTTGKLTLSLYNSDIAGNIGTATTTGASIISLVNLSYMSDCALNVDATTGSIQLTIDQRVNMGSNVSGSVSLITGNIELEYYDDRDDTSINCRSSTVTGSADQYTSPEHPALYYYDLQLQTTTGSIDITTFEN